jgi:hypothetical protein
MRKSDSGEFKTPFDGVFREGNLLGGYSQENTDNVGTAFEAYLRTGDWAGVLADATFVELLKLRGRLFKKKISQIYHYFR